MIALALSGGGYRATLYHLGVIRSLVERGKLKDVDVICSVSGGSILAAHLLLNWERYNDLNEFDSAAQSLLKFVNSDMRSRVFNQWLWLRFGWLVLAVGIFLWAFAIPEFWWQVAGGACYLFCVGILNDPFWKPTWSRIDFLVDEYERALFANRLSRLAIGARIKPWLVNLIQRWGVLAASYVIFLASLIYLDWFRILTSTAAILFIIGVWISLRNVRRPHVRTPLASLRQDGLKRPKLYILSTNLNTGNLCGFTDDGLFLWEENDTKGPFGPGRVSIAEAVAASSSFPPAFPPYRLLREDIGQTSEALDPVLLLTDGGVFDNSGIQGILEHSKMNGLAGRAPESDAEKKVLIVSNAERRFDSRLDESLFWLRLLVFRSIRANDIVMRRVSKSQNAAAQAAGWTVIPIRLEDHLPDEDLASDLQDKVRNFRTDLNSFSFVEIQLTVYYGYLRASYDLIGHSISSNSSQVPSEPAPPDAGFRKTNSRLPVSASREMWLPYGEDKMSSNPNLEQSATISIFRAAILPLTVGLSILFVAAGSSWTFSYFQSQPASVSFESLFPEITEDKLERMILAEINEDDILRNYKLSLLRGGEKDLFFGLTKPLGEYVGKRTPAEFHCKVTCTQNDCGMKVRLFLRKEGNKVNYLILPTPKDEPTRFVVPEAGRGDRIIAIGVINDKKDDDLKKIIHLEVVK